ncbi:PepSY domain-containing protein [candidate division KSB1 bacterium]|nr:PepSY domain-containing protein [candidate division KSB1 bacterium]
MRYYHFFVVGPFLIFFLGCSAKSNLKKQNPAKDAIPVTSLHIEFDSLLTTPILIQGNLDSLKNIQPSQYETQILTFIEKNYQFFKLKKPAEELKLSQIKTDEIGFLHLTFERQVKSVPVWADELKFHVNEEKILYQFNGRYRASLSDDFNCEPQLSLIQAKELAKIDARETIKADSIQRSLLIIYSKDGQLYLAYFFNFQEQRLSPVNWDYFIDANTGKILERHNNLRTNERK